MKLISRINNHPLSGFKARMFKASLQVVPAVITLSFASLATAQTNDLIHVDASSFDCVTDMQPVRGFYVDNLLGQVEETIAVANSKSGGRYPVGSVVQLVPTEVMVKQPAGTNSSTNDWEFFELNVDSQGTKIAKRGYTDVVNRFGGNCFGCHIQAKPKWDLICESNHGCQPIPVTKAMLEALQRSDPRCSPANPLRQQDLDALKALADMSKNKP